jgi:hypothetical protein
MGFTSSLLAIANAIDPQVAYWSIVLRSGKEWSERSMIVTWHKGRRGVRQLDWGDDIVSTGDVHRIKEIKLHCPDGRVAVLEIGDGMEPFQFKTRSLEMIGAGDRALEYMVIGRVIDKVSGRCECFIWDYRPKAGEQHLLAYKSTIYNFGGWRDTVTPIGALGIEVQGFRL